MTTTGFRGSEEMLDAVDRSVTDVPGAGTHATTVRLSRSYATSVEDLWEAATTPERLARWFSPVHGDLRLGGRFQVEGNAGGTVESCEPPTAYRVTWEMGGAVSYVDVTVEPDGDARARLTLVHSGDIADEFWEQFGPGAVGVGWDLAFAGLGHHLETGSDLVLEATEWGATDEAKAFMTSSSRRWAEAALTAGTPEADARAREAATTAFYTGG